MSATLKKHLLLVITVFYFSFAQSQKIAHCNYDSLLEVMPERKIADSLLQDFSAYLNGQYKKMQKKIDSLNNELNKNSQVWSSGVITQKQKEIQANIDQGQNFQIDARRRIDERREELIMQLRKKVVLAISLVAKENGYVFILNSALQSDQVLYFDQANNVTLKVKKKMDFMQPAWVH